MVKYTFLSLIQSVMMIMHIFSFDTEPKDFISRFMQIRKSIKIKKSLKNNLRLNTFLDCGLWSDGNYIGTVMMVQLPISLNTILKTRQTKRKRIMKQMKIFDFEFFRYPE